LVFKALGGRVYLWMYWRDVRRETIPLRIWLNPLRYELSIRAFRRLLVINREGKWARIVPNAIYRMRVAR
jgi:hypothetical protein